MYSLAHDHVVSSAELWVRLVARKEVGVALSTLEEAGAALIQLAADANWESEGLRALHVLLRRLRDDTGAELGQLKAREWELTAG